MTTTRWQLRDDNYETTTTRRQQRDIDDETIGQVTSLRNEALVKMISSNLPEYRVTPPILCKIPSNKKRLKIASIHAKSLREMKVVVTTLAEAIPVRGRVRDIYDKSCYLVQYGCRRHRHDARYWPHFVHTFVKVWWRRPPLQASNGQLSNLW